MEFNNFGSSSTDKNSGTGNLVYFQKPENLVLAPLPASPSTPTEHVTIATDHTMAVGVDGWYVGKHKNRKAEFNISDEGDIDVNAANHQLTIFVPENNEVAAMCKQKGEDFIVLVTPKDCVNGKKIQLGTACNPAILEKWRYGVGKYDGTEAKGFYVTFSCVQASVIYYTGAIVSVVED